MPLIQFNQFRNNYDTCEKYFGSSDRQRAREARIRLPVKISDALDNNGTWDEQIWSTTNGEFGAIKPTGEFDSTHLLSSAKYFIPDHPHWTKPVTHKARFQTTYSELGQQFPPMHQ